MLQSVCRRSGDSGRLLRRVRRRQPCVKPLDKLEIERLDAGLATQLGATLPDGV